MKTAMLFLIIALVCVLMESFFSMFEMACVSLNKVKLRYWAAKKTKRAVWLEFLLNKPSNLFGTTIIAVNTVMQIGSEAARRFYESLNLSPDWAPLSQIIVVLIFGELAPLFAARRHSEHVAYLSVPIVYVISRIFTPLVWVIEKISKASNLLFGRPKLEFFLSKEELQKALEEPTKSSKIESKSLDTIISSIFSLKEKQASSIMIPINLVKIIPSNFTLNQLQRALSLKYFPCIPLYHNNVHNIVAVAYPRDLLKANENNRVMDFAKPPWFITEDMLTLDVLKQFRTNNQSIAVVVDKSGKSIGFITLDQIEDLIFGRYPLDIKKPIVKEEIIIEKTLPGDMLLLEFNKKFKSNLQYKDAKTLSDLIILVLDHHPSIGEILHFEKYEFTVVEPTLLGIEKVKVKTII